MDIPKKNTFKFERFSQKLEDIDVDIFHKVPHRYEAETSADEIDTHFYQAIKKWNTCNLTINYKNFKYEVKDIITLPQLLYYKQRVLDVIMKYIKMKDPLCLQTFLEILVAVSRDLQKDFYEYFPTILQILLDLLQMKGVNQVEEKENIVRHTFTSLAYMFKFLWRYMVKDITTLFGLLLPLLSDCYPVYMRLFAADSFKFIVRKIKNKQSFTIHLFKTLEKHKESISGCGALLFEVILGVQYQFHSCAKDMLTLYFDALNDKSLKQQLVNDVLVEVINHATRNINTDKSEVLLSIFEVFTSKFLQISEKQPRKHPLIFVLHLLNIVINHKGGIMFKQKDQIIANIMQILKNTEENDELIAECVNILTNILLAPNISLKDGIPYLMICKMLSVGDKELKLSTIERLIHYTSFELHILNKILKNIELDSSFLRLYAKIIKEKKKPTFNIESSNNWTKYPLPIDINNNQTKELFLELLKTLSEEQISDDVVRVLIILPHLYTLPKELEIEFSKGIIFIYKKLLNNENCENKHQKLSFVFLLAIDAVSHIKEPNKFIKFIDECGILFFDLVKNNINDICILNAFDLFLYSVSKSDLNSKYINVDTLEQITEFLSVQLSSPNPRIRLLVTHIFSLFSNTEGVIINPDDNSEKNALLLSYLSEKTKVNISTYRERLLYLQDLEFQNQIMVNLNPKFIDLILRYLIGNFYVNFSLLWEPVSKIVASYANKKCIQFWPIFYSELTTEKKIDEIDTSLYKCDVITLIASEILQYNENVDFQNYKLLLWKCMSYFPEYAESKTRDLTPLFISFVESQFSKSSIEVKSCNIIKNNQFIDDKEDDEDEEAEIENKLKPKFVQFASAGFKNNMLLAQLQIFAKAVNPRMAYREPELYNIYLDLLCSRKTEIQKAALNCILCYKHKYLTPYKENLMNLFDEKKLKNELTRFHIDNENKIVIDEHREGLIPIIMRIIYSKMMMRVGLRTGGKGGGQARRKMILRYLAGSQESEMMVFAQMAFKPFQKYVPFTLDSTVNPKLLVKQIMDNIDLANVIPPKRLQSTVNLISIFIDEFGAKMSKQVLPKLLALLLCILSEATAMLNMTDKIYIGYLPAIKNLKTSCISILARFFLQLENYEWTDSEIDALFEVAVFPWLEKLPVEGIHSPTALLKMFTIWGGNSRYFPLLIKYKEGNMNLTPLVYITRLLLNQKTAPSVINSITEMFEKLLTLEDYKVSEEGMEVDGTAKPLTNIVTNKLNVDLSILCGKANFGSAILLPHVLPILNFMKIKLQKRKRLNKTEFSILSRITELTSDAEISDALLELIIPITVKKSARGEAEDMMIELITTLINLMKNVKDPTKHLRCIIPLLSTISSVPARKLLLTLFDTIAQGSIKDELNKQKLIREVEILQKLNAYDQRWFDQPDFEKRLNAFDAIQDLIKANDISLELGTSVIHNCFFFLQTDNDLAIRDISGYCLKSTGVKLANACKNNTTDRKYLIEETILMLVRKGIRSKKEAVQYASISFLGHMAMECFEVHPVLRDLSLLTNKQDPEVDFFENTIHLQIHRRGRALLKFCSVAETLEKPFNSKTLTQFILPLASSYLCNEVFIKKHSLVDNAIKAITAVCRLLPWHQYQIVLKFYLDKLRCIEFQKQAVRIVTGILDAFHYDLSKNNDSFIEEHEEETKKTDDSFIRENKEEIEKIISENTDEKLKENTIEEEDMDEALQNDEEEEEVVEKNNDKVLAMQKLTILSSQMANKLIFAISKGILPQLNRAIIAKTHYEKMHKINKNNKDTQWNREEEDLVRIPLAFAMVKLLQKLPKKLLHYHLPGIFMKLCSFLKSELESVRKTTREILQSIMTTLGPEYLHYLLREMNTLLTKGFQVHVLSFTTHAVLRTLKPYIKPSDMSENLQSILSVCRIDIFGQTAEEKEIAAITKSVSEAKVTKSFDIFNILAECIDESCMIDLLMPVKDALLKTKSHKVMVKVNRCLKQIALGFSVNKYIQPDKMLLFLYGVVSESIPYLLPENESEEDKKLTKLTEKPDCYLIAPEPKNRMGERTESAKTSKNTNIHVLVEFGLRLFELLLNKNSKEHNAIKNAQYKPQLDPFLPVLNNSLKSKHVTLTTTAMRCIKSLLSQIRVSDDEEIADIPSIKLLLPEILASIFSILHKYAVANLSKGDNLILVATCFKTLSTIIANCDNVILSDDQLQLLLIYIEQDLYDSEKFATAIDLMKKIIKRKYMHSNIPNLMQKVRELSITSLSENVRQQSRNLFYIYLKTYYLNNIDNIKKTDFEQIKLHLAFYCNQLSYDLEPGRMSALLMIQNMIANFPEKIIIYKLEKKENNNIYGYLFLMLSAALVNDKEPSFCKHCAKCIKELILRLKHNERSVLFSLIITFIKDKKLEHRLMATQTCGIFVSAEKENFESRLHKILPILLKQFQNQEDKKIGSHIKDAERLQCHYEFQVLQLILKISNYCNNLFVKQEYTQYVDYFSEKSQDLLKSNHLWVRLAAAQFLGFVLASIDVERLENLLQNPNNAPETGYIYSNCQTTLKSLSLDLINQLHPEMEVEDFTIQIIKNLVCIAKLIKTLQPNVDKKDETDENNKTNNISLLWLMKKIRRAINNEISQTPTSTIVRMSMFKWIAGVLTIVPIDYLKPLLFHMISPLVREMTTVEVSNAPLRQLSKEVGLIIKKNIGSDEYIKLLNKAQSKLEIRRAERKKVRSQQVVTNPELAAKRKIIKNQKKKEAKKRKMVIIKGKGLPNKRFKKEKIDEYN